MVLDFLLGKFLIILAFITTCFSIYFFVIGKKAGCFSLWERIGSKLHYVSTALIFSASIRLMYLILTHQFQYNYVKHYSSSDLNVFYLLSTFYAGQEGSFLLWLMYGTVIGLAVIYLERKERSSTMAVISFSQAFLLSMLLGIDIVGLGVVGSDPFSRTVGEVALEGDGLNPLLQNPWMVIHPPTLFAGYSLVVVPFAYAISAMWHNDYKRWTKVVMPWVISASAVLGLGITLGGYWAYGVLGWGGYWGWDPVENSSLVPWLLLVALFHVLVIQKKRNRLIRTSLFLAVIAYVFVLYSAFLTRSGVLADYSVHSFTDLGLYHQLLFFVITFLVLGMSLFFMRSIHMGEFLKKSQVLSKELFLLLGSLTIMLIASVVALGTSAPILNQMFTGNPDPILPEFYSDTTYPLAVVLIFLLSIGQLVWWEKEKKTGSFVVSFLRSFLLSIAFLVVFVLFGFNRLDTLLLFVGALFAFIINLEIFFKTAKKSRFSGGSIAHMGVALMLIGIVASEKYDNSMSVELPAGKPVPVLDKVLTFQGTKEVDKGKTGFEILISDNEDTDIVMPVLYRTKRMTVQNPDIISSFTNDFYVSPMDYYVNENPNEIILSQQDEKKHFQGYDVMFVGFNYEKSILSPPKGKDVSVVAKIKLVKGDSAEMVEPEFKVSSSGEVNSPKQELSLVSKGSLQLKNIDATNRRVHLAFNGFPQEASQEVLVIEASIKPYIILLWIGTVLVFIGMVLSSSRRAKERRQTL